MAVLSNTAITKLIVNEGSAPSTPAASTVTIYAKADGLMYSKDDAGTETLMSSGLASSSTTAPTFVAAGTSATGTGDITPGLPTGHAANDILLLFVQSNRQTATAPAGYAQLGPMVGLGTAAAAGGVRGAVFWKRDGGSESAPTVTDTGDHTLAQIMAIRGCPTTGDPFRSVGQTRKTTASTTGTGSAGATCTDNCLVVQAFFHALDSASAVFSSWTNASLSAVTEQIDVATADGNGGGIGVATGLLATAGAFVATTVTETSTTDVGTCFYMLPSGFTLKGEAVDIQVFLDAGLADTYTKPSGAKIIDIYSHGGGASGSGGRNAATAAGGGGGGGGAFLHTSHLARDLAATLVVTAGAGGAASGNSDSSASNAGNTSSVTTGGNSINSAGGGSAAGASGSGSGGLGGNGSGSGAASAASTDGFDVQPPGGGTGGTTGGAGGAGRGQFNGGAGGGGGTSQAATAGGNARFGGAGGAGGRASGTAAGTGGGSQLLGVITGGATHTAGNDSAHPMYGGSGGGGGSSALAGAGGFPGGGGGGGGTGSGAQSGGAGGDGRVVIVTLC